MRALLLTPQPLSEWEYHAIVPVTPSLTDMILTNMPRLVSSFILASLHFPSHSHRRNIEESSTFLLSRRPLWHTTICVHKSPLFLYKSQVTSIKPCIASERHLLVQNLVFESLSFYYFPFLASILQYTNTTSSSGFTSPQLLAHAS